jgi:hypothetical protein
MNNEPTDESITEAINILTEKLSKVLLEEFLALPAELHINVVLIKIAQLLLANILCQVAENSEELNKISALQGPELKELASHCAIAGFSDKFDLNKH